METQCAGVMASHHPDPPGELSVDSGRRAVCGYQELRSLWIGPTLWTGLTSEHLDGAVVVACVPEWGSSAADRHPRQGLEGAVVIRASTFERGADAFAERAVSDRDHNIRLVVLHWS